MPIFLKEDRSVYFAHIPKTAGSATYILFLKNGWSIANVQTSSKNKGRIGYRLLKEFGIENVPTIGSRLGYKWSLQHAPTSIWSNWGNFHSSFAIVRDPYARFVSCAAYHARSNGIKRNLQDLVDERIEFLTKTSQDDADRHPPLFRRQVDFVAPETKLIKLEENWQFKLKSLYGFEIVENEYVNKSKPNNITLSDNHIEFIDRYYKPDFDLWQSA